MQGFASDNISGVHEKVMNALLKANNGHVPPYGNDEYTKKAADRFRELFGESIDVFFVFNGTAANVLSLAAAARSFHSVIVSAESHMNVDECGAPEKFTGCKTIPVPSKGGKLSLEDIRPLLKGFDDPHHSRPKVVSITQPTELGEVYTTDEIAAIAGLAHENGLCLHMDGARIANAVAHLNIDPREMTSEAGVDILSFGGTKNGIMYGEAVVFFDRELAEHFNRIRKQGMQLGSKMRFIAAQFDALLADGLWLESAAHANRMAERLYLKIKDLAHVEVTEKVQSNVVFAAIPGHLVEILQKEYYFYTWDETLSKVRLMTCFNTTEDQVDRFADTIRYVSVG
ncbi:MAG: low specificity L-threonine aldolase [Desulfobacteraceae bacterium]